MTAWNHPARWKSLCSGAACPICLRGEPLEIIAALESSWLTMPESAPLRGYVCLVSRIHAVELHHLPAAFFADAQQVSAALQSVTGAVKLNYEIHGNTIPHLHIHFYPRYPGDRFAGQPIDPKRTHPSPYAPGEFHRLRAALQFFFLAAIGRTLSNVKPAAKNDGTPILKYNGKFLAGLATHRSAESNSLVVRATPPDRAALLDEAPETFYTTPYYRRHHVVLARLKNLDPSQIRDLLLSSAKLLHTAK